MIEGARAHRMKRPPQFSLATLFVVQTVCAVAFAIWAGLEFGALLFVIIFGGMMAFLIAGTVWLARPVHRNRTRLIEGRFATYLHGAILLFWAMVVATVAVINVLGQ